MVSDIFFIAYCTEMVLTLLAIMGLTIWITDAGETTERDRRLRFQNRYLTVSGIVIILTFIVAITCKVNNV